MSAQHHVKIETTQSIWTSFGKEEMVKITIDEEEPLFRWFLTHSHEYRLLMGWKDRLDQYGRYLAYETFLDPGKAMVEDIRAIHAHRVRG